MRRRFAGRDGARLMVAAGAQFRSVTMSQKSTFMVNAMRRHLRGAAMPTTINLWVGTIKIKRLSQLRSVEQKKLVPLVKIGKTYIIWWSRANERLYKTPGSDGRTSA